MKAFPRSRGQATASLATAVTVAVLLTNMAAPSEAFPCFASYTNNPYNCSCSIHEDSNILSCNANENGGMTVKLTAKNTATVLCNSNVTVADFHHLDGTNISFLVEMRFEHCPMPRQTFRQIFQIQNPLETKYLAFVFKVRDEELTDQLEGLKELRFLDLSFNSFRQIDPEALAPVSNLRELYLRRNRLSSVSKELMDKVPKLEYLDLGENAITNLSPGVFSNVPALRTLGLDKNKLANASLTAETFKGLGNLTMLDIGYNNLEYIPGDVFKHLGNLKTLGLSGNSFQVLPEGLLSPLTQLQTVKLVGHSGSKLVLPPGLFANLTQLLEINMDSSNLEALPEDIFYGAVSLINVSLKGNRLRELPKTLFISNPKIKNLNLMNNQIGGLPTSIFKNLTELQELDLSNNQIVNITEATFYGPTNMTKLSMANNRLSYIDGHAFRGSDCKLTWIDLSNNFLTLEDGFKGAPDQSPLSHCHSLKVINLSNNSIEHIDFSDFIQLNEPTINLRRNKVRELSWQTVNNIVGTIDLQNNNISKISLDENLEFLLNRSVRRGKTEILLDGNPMHCDCDNFLFVKYLKGLKDKDESKATYKLVDLVANTLACASPRNFEGRLLKEVSPEELTCPLKPEARSKPCPSSCECKIRTADKALIVQCVGAHLTTAPEELPTSGESNHTELNISNNAISELPMLNQPGYEHVTKLYASHNRINKISIFAIPPTLQVLELDHNNLTKLKPEVIEFIENNLTNLTSLTLHNNSWDCRCESFKFINFIQGIKNKIPYLKQVKCTWPYEGRIVSELLRSEVCTNVSAILWIILVIAISVLICVAVIIYYRYQQEIKVWLFAHRMCLWWVTEEELDRDKRYDAFLCFSSKDQDFVENELAPNLESGPTPFKLCIHTRDWIPGAWITNQIIESVEDSRRTIIVLSPNFVDSEWGKMEFRTAHAQAMSEGRARVIVVLYGDVGPIENLEPELRAYLNMNTYVKWGDPWFWDKLRYALPHPPELLRSHPAMSLVRQASLRRKPLEDRLELICDPNCPSVIVSPSSPDNDDTIINNEKNAKLNENGIMLSPQKTAPAAS